MDLICRAHMVVEDGYEFYNDRTLVTVFSAPKCVNRCLLHNDLSALIFIRRIAIAASLTTLEQSCQFQKTCYAPLSFSNPWTARH